MLEREELISLAGELSPVEVTKYARSRGWYPVAGVIRSDILILSNDKYKLKQLLVPKSKTEDYADAVFEVLRRLQVCEGRLMRDIMRDMRIRRKEGFSFKIRCIPYAKWQWKPELNRRLGYLAWLFIWLNFSWEYDD